MLIDLSHTFEDGMPGARFKDRNGDSVELTAHLRPYMTHSESECHYDGKSSFEVTDVAFQTSVGTKLDAPRHRFPGAEDIASIELDRLVLTGVVSDLRDTKPRQQIEWSDLGLQGNLEGQALLLNFGWDRHWGTETYRSHPFLSRDALRQVQRAGIKLLGVDCSNVDSTSDMERPAHTWFLRDGILIIENLTGLSALHGKSFRFFAIPLKAREAAAFPVRAFAEILDN